MTMYLKFCVAIALMQITLASFGTVFAANEKTMTPPPGGLLQGTPEEQAACAPDSTRFCRDFIPDTFRVLACLQEHRRQLRRACLKVLEDHGQ